MSKCNKDFGVNTLSFDCLQSTKFFPKFFQFLVHDIITSWFDPLFTLKQEVQQVNTSKWFCVLVHTPVHQVVAIQIVSYFCPYFSLHIYHNGKVSNQPKNLAFLLLFFYTEACEIQNSLVFFHAYLNHLRWLPPK